MESSSKPSEKDPSPVSVEKKQIPKAAVIQKDRKKFSLLKPMQRSSENQLPKTLSAAKPE